MNYNFVSTSSLAKGFSIVPNFKEQLVLIKTIENPLLDMENTVAEEIYNSTGLTVTHYQGSDNDIIFHYACGKRLISLFIDADDEGYVADSATNFATGYLPKQEAITSYLKLLKDS